MDSKGRGRRLDRTGSRQGREGSHGLPRRLIGVIGKSVLTDAEKQKLYRFGQCIAILGHTTAVIPTKGTADQVSEGVKAQGGEIRVLESGVIDASDHTFVYPDSRLLSRLQHQYPNLTENKNVTVIREDQLDRWLVGTIRLINELGLTPP